MTTRTPRQRRARATRERLLAEGTALFASAGYAQTTATGIAAAASVATGSFYQYFRNKDELLGEIARTRIEQHAARLREVLQPLSGGAAPDDELRARVELVIGEVWEHHASDPALHATITERRHADPELDRVCADVEQGIVADAARFLSALGADDDPQALAFVLFSLVEGAVHAHVLGARPTDHDRLRLTLIEAVLRVIRPSLPGGHGSLTS